jgi:hypothetical protein
MNRHVSFEACFNFRDLGGYESGDGRRVRWGVLFRSDTLHRLTSEDAGTLRALGLRTIVDLRSLTEIEDHGRIEESGAGFVWHNVPMSDNLKLAVSDPPQPAPPLAPVAAEPVAPGEGYFAIAEQYGDSLAKVFSILSDETALPAVFHCTSGKDRTGIVAALLLELLGVPDDVIVEDYVLTEAARDRSSAWIEAHEPDFAAFLAQIPPERRVTSPDSIRGFLRLLRTAHGSAEQFLVERGVHPDRLDALRERILAEGPPSSGAAAGPNG